MHTKLFCRLATGWTGGADKSRSGVWLPRALALFEESWAAAAADPRQRPWLDSLPTHWPRVDPDFAALRAFQVSTSAASVVVPKSRLGGSDSVIKALEVDSGASIVRHGINYSSSGFIAWRYRCFRSLEDHETAAVKNEKIEKKAVASTITAEPSAVKNVAETAAASLALLSQLGAEPSNAAAEQLVADLQAASAASGSGESKRRPSRAAAVGADSAETAPPNPLGCQCKYQLWVYYPIVGKSA